MADNLHRLLIVDDDKGVREGLTRIVDWEGCGFQVIAALKDGEEAIEFIKSHQVEAVLTDIMMTFVSGLSLAKFIYNEKLPVKVVLISGYQEFELAKEALRYQVYEYLQKPTDVDEVYRVFRGLKEQLDQDHMEKRKLAELLGGHPAQQFMTAMNLEAQERSADGEKTHESERKVIRQVMQYIKLNADKDITLNEVAEEVFLSPVYLSRLIKMETGKTFTDYVVKARMDHAAQLLQNTNMKIYEISEQVGYKDVRHFYKLFKKHTSHTPKEYRERH